MTNGSNAKRENRVRAGMAGRLLLQAFPHVRFTYRLDAYFVRFFWTNGPTERRVRDVLEQHSYSNGVLLFRGAERRPRHLRLVR
jgi:hypothetical protein